MQILVQADIATTKRGTFQQKKSKNNPFVVKSVLNPIENFSVKVQYEITSTGNLTHRCKKNSFQWTMELCLPTQWSKREVYPIFSINVWTRFEHPVQNLSTFRKVWFFSVFAGQIHIFDTIRATNEQVKH